MTDILSAAIPKADPPKMNPLPPACQLAQHIYCRYHSEIILNEQTEIIERGKGYNRHFGCCDTESRPPKVDPFP